MAKSLAEQYYKARKKDTAQFMKGLDKGKNVTKNFKRAKYGKMLAFK